MDSGTFTVFMEKLNDATWTVHNVMSNTLIFKSIIAHELLELYTTDIDGLLYVNNEKPDFTVAQKEAIDDFIQDLVVSMSEEIVAKQAERNQKLSNDITAIINS